MNLYGTYFAIGNCFSAVSSTLNIGEVFKKKNFQDMFDVSFYGYIDAENNICIFKDRNGITISKINSPNVDHTEIIFSREYVNKCFSSVDMKMYLSHGSASQGVKSYSGVWSRVVSEGQEPISGVANMVLTPLEANFLNAQDVYKKLEKCAKKELQGLNFSPKLLQSI